MRNTHVEPSRLREALNRLAEAGKVAAEPERGPFLRRRAAGGYHGFLVRCPRYYGGLDGSRIGKQVKKDEANDSDSENGQR